MAALCVVRSRSPIRCWASVFSIYQVLTVERDPYWLDFSRYGCGDTHGVLS
ncbi:MAG: hypothetical protein AAGA01_09265 [Cyanobacteria bacterium P01_E01_bin.43]